MKSVLNYTDHLSSFVFIFNSKEHIGIEIVHIRMLTAYVFNIIDIFLWVLLLENQRKGRKSLGEDSPKNTPKQTCLKVNSYKC